MTEATQSLVLQSTSLDILPNRTNPLQFNLDSLLRRSSIAATAIETGNGPCYFSGKIRWEV